MLFRVFLCGALMYFQTCFAEIKAVLFDCDGTLVDSEYAHYLGWKKALADFGSEFPADEYHQYVGKSAQANAALLAEKIGKDCPEKILEIKREYYRKLCDEGIAAIEPTVAFLKGLVPLKKSRGLKIGVCSAAKKQDILSHIRHLGIESMIDIVLSGQEDLSEYSDPEGVNKPKPYVYLHAMKKLGVTPAECVVIEDSASGVIAGVSAGCFTIAVPNEYTRRQDLSRAHLHLESFEGIDNERFFQMVKIR